MVVVRTVKIDGEPIHVFNSAIYIFESSSGFTLDVDLIVSEVVKKRYINEKSLIVEIELEDGRIINSIMHVKVLTGKLPQLNLYIEIDKADEYPGFLMVNEASLFPNIEEGITLEEIRRVEMPNEKITLKLNLPIEQTEWLMKQKKSDLDEMFKEIIYDYRKKRNS
jgi:hypothetical protein